MTTRAVTVACLALVKHYEGLYLNAYLCPAGVPTIGWGHTKGVTMGQSISREKADVLLAADMAEAARHVDRLVTAPLMDHQRDALASFVFNLGAGNLASSTLLKKLNAKDYEGAAGEFGKWVYATVGGVKTQLAGLVARRAAEAAMFRGADWKAAAEQQQRMPQAVVPAAPMKPLAQSRTMQAGQVGLGLSVVTGTLAQVSPMLEQVQGIGGQIGAIRAALPDGSAGYVMAALLAGAVVFMLWRRYEDHRQQRA